MIFELTDTCAAPLPAKLDLGDVNYRDEPLSDLIFGASLHGVLESIHGDPGQDGELVYLAYSRIDDVFVLGFYLEDEGCGAAVVARCSEDEFISTDLRGRLADGGVWMTEEGIKPQWVAPHLHESGCTVFRDLTLIVL